VITDGSYRQTTERPALITTTMIGGIHIPSELFLEIKLFLTEYEYWKLLITADYAFAELRFSTRMIYLNFKDAKSVLEKSEELQALSLKVQSTKTQLYLKQVHMIGQHSDRILKFDCFFVVSCDYALSADFFLTRFGLMIQHSSQRFPLAVTRDSLKIYSCFNTIQFKSLKNLKRLKLHDCRAISEVHSLKDLDVLEISNCEAITDVSELGKIHKLCIIYCHGIKDISGLTNDYSLTVNQCSNVRRVPKTVNCVVFGSTFSITGIKFPQLKRIEISHTEIKYLFVASHKLFKVRICDSDVVQSLQGLKTVPVVELISLQNLRDIDSLGENKFVYIFYCNAISSFSSLKNVPKVTIWNCTTFRSGYDVENVRYLQILYCNNFSNPNMLGNVFDLTLALDRKMESLLGICNVPYLTVEVFAVAALNVEILASTTEQISLLLGSLGNDNKRFTFSYSCYEAVKPLLTKVVHNYHIVFETRDEQGCLRSVMITPKVILLKRS
jgi:hypothetical protein